MRWGSLRLRHTPNRHDGGRLARFGARGSARPLVVLGAGAAVIATVIGSTLIASPAGAASAGSEITLTKTVDKSTQASHGAVTWTINYSCSSTVNPSCDDVKITDVLPAALLLDAADVGLVGDHNAPASGIHYEPTTGTATFALVSPLPVGTTGQVKITARTPVGSTPDGTVTANVATATCGNCTTTATSNLAPVTWTATPSFREIKLVYSTSGSQVTYQIDPLANAFDGNRDLDNAVFTDQLPAGAKYVTSTDGGVYDAVKNTVTWTLDKLAVTSSHQFRVRVDLAGIPTGTNVVNTVTGVGTNPDTKADYPINPSSVSCVVGSNCKPQPAINAVKSVVLGQGSYTPGSFVTFRLSGSVATTTPLSSPVFVDWAPAGFTYVSDAGVIPTAPNTPTPTSVKVTTVGGRQAIEIFNDGATLAPGIAFQYTLKFVIGADVAPGAYSNQLYIGSPTQLASSGYVCNSAIATRNPGFAGLGDPTLCASGVGVVVQQASSLVITKDGKGDSDADWQAYPNVGHSTSGGTAQWRVTISNPSAQAFSKINVLDILPSTAAVGDTEVLSATARDSKFATAVTAPVAGPAGRTVYYSTVLNPCRRTNAGGSTPGALLNSTYESAGCNAPAWSTTFPTAGSVTALWFAVAGPLAPGAKAQFTISYTVPKTTAVGDIAWNSLAFNATSATGDALLPAEPLKVGIAVVAPATPTPSPVVTPSPTPGSGIDPITITPTPLPATSPTPTPTPGGSGIDPITLVATPTPVPGASGTEATDLASTGATTYQPLLLGGALLIGGLGLLLVARRRRGSDA